MSVYTSNHGAATRVLTIDRPPVNALDDETIQSLSSAVEATMENTETRVLVITGGVKTFAAGADLDELVAADQHAGRKMVSRVKGLQQILRGGPKPVIAAINGIAAGGGLELAMACDIRVADRKGKLGLPEVTLGVLPGAGGTQMLPRLIGIGKALELMLSGRIIMAEEAFTMGLVECLAEEGCALKEALMLAEKMSGHAPLAMAEIKAAAYDTLSMPLRDGLNQETERFARLCESADKKEGIEAFKARRAPVFEGR